MAILVYWGERGMALPTICLRGTVPDWLNRGVRLLPILEKDVRYRLYLSDEVYQQFDFYMKCSKYEDQTNVLKEFTVFLSGIGGELLEILGPDRQCLLSLKQTAFTRFQCQVLGVGAVIFFSVLLGMIWFDKKLISTEHYFKNQLFILKEQMKEPKEPLLSSQKIDCLWKILLEWPVSVSHISVTSDFFRVEADVLHHELWNLKKRVEKWESFSGLKSTSRFSFVSEETLQWVFVVYL